MVEVNEYIYIQKDWANLGNNNDYLPWLNVVFSPYPGRKSKKPYNKQEHISVDADNFPVSKILHE